MRHPIGAPDLPLSTLFTVTGALTFEPSPEQEILQNQFPEKKKKRETAQSHPVPSTLPHGSNTHQQEAKVCMSICVTLKLPQQPIKKRRAGRRRIHCFPLRRKLFDP
jgi:hypothetical protein